MPYIARTTILYMILNHVMEIGNQLRNRNLKKSLKQNICIITP